MPCGGFWFTGPWSQVGGLTPGVGGLTPGVGGLTPGVGWLTPVVGGLTPGVGGLTPGVGGLTPGVGGLTPGVYFCNEFNTIAIAWMAPGRGSQWLIECSCVLIYICPIVPSFSNIYSFIGR